MLTHVVPCLVIPPNDGSCKRIVGVAPIRGAVVFATPPTGGSCKIMGSMGMVVFTAPSTGGSCIIIGAAPFVGALTHESSRSIWPPP